MKNHVIWFKGTSLDIASHKLDNEPLGSAFFNILKSFVIDTYEKCSYHRNRMNRAKLNPLEISSFEDFRKIPPLGLDDVNSISEFSFLPDSYSKFMADGLSELPRKGRFAKKFSSSGSTGKPKVVYYTLSDWEASLAAIIRSMGRISLSRYSRVFNCFNPGHVAGKVFEDAFSRHGCIVENKHFTIIDDDGIVQQLYGGLKDYGGFNCLALPPCTPPGIKVKKGGTLDGILNADLDNYIGKNIKVIVTTGAPRDLPEFKLKERVWEANELANAEKTIFIDMAGCAEVLPTVAECGYSDGLHLMPGLTYTEVIDPKTGNPVKNNGRGLLLYTGLKHGSRYLRYIVGDEATYLEDKCRCGRSTPRIKDIARVLEKERLKGGCAAGL